MTVAFVGGIPPITFIAFVLLVFAGIPGLIWLYYRGKAAMDQAVRDYAKEQGVRVVSMRSSWVPPARLVLHHTKGSMWYSVKFDNGERKHIRVKSIVTHITNFDVYE